MEREPGRRVPHPLGGNATVLGDLRWDRADRLVMTVAAEDEAKGGQALEDARHARVLLPGEPPRDLAYLGFRLRSRGGQSIPAFLFAPLDRAG